VPSIVYGLLALGLFVYTFGLGQSILSAGLTLALLILPIVIVATREALRSIPQHIREGAYACGASQWQVVAAPPAALLAARHPDRRDHRHGTRHRRNGPDHHHRRADLHRLPAAGAGFRRTPRRACSTGSRPFTVMPIQIFNWISRPDPASTRTPPPPAWCWW
jgi:phosphate transport system permease protein